MAYDADSFFWRLGALLLGGLAASLLVTVISRSRRGRERLLATSGWTLTGASFLAVLLALAPAYWIVRPLLDGRGAAQMAGPVVFLVGGLLLGVPLSLPGVLVAWREVRAREKRRRTRSRATRADRRAYAEDLVRQIREASPEARSLEAVVTGDGGTVLRFVGDLRAREGERLTEALREDLGEMGFKRVEGRSGEREWWTRV
jgi:hypothetical protein